MSVDEFNIILDLDETLINSISYKEWNKLSKTKQEKLINNFEYVDMKYDSENKDFEYRIFLRPNLNLFLEYLFSSFRVAIWTAASKEYATFIVDNIIKKEGDVYFIFFSYQCDYSEKFFSCIKDLSLLWKVFKLEGFDQTNTKLIDDLVATYNAQKDNVFLAEPFNVLDPGSEKDEFLLKIIDKLEKFKFSKYS